MLKLLKYGIVLCILISTKSFGQDSKHGRDIDTTMTDYYKSYIGKKVSDLLSDETIKNFCGFTFFDEKPLVLSGAIITVSNSITAKIFVSEFKFVKQYDPERVWNRHLFSKENITRIQIFKKDKCIIDTGR